MIYRYLGTYPATEGSHYVKLSPRYTFRETKDFRMHKVISKDHPISTELIYLASTVLQTLSDERISGKMTVVPRKMVMIMWKRHAFISSRCGRNVLAGAYRL